MDSSVLDGVTSEISRDQLYADENAAYARSERLAARAARRYAARNHVCAGPGCTDRNHRRDVYHATLLREALAVQDAPPPTEADYDDPVGFASMTRHDVASMRGLR